MTQKLQCDILIIGGGINGCGIAADAATRGLKVVLCEQADLGEATSSASSKLIHGGLRYLEQYHFGLVRKALKERERLFQLCPYLITPLAFILPYKKSLRPFWLIRLGLFIYDHLTKISVPKTQVLSKSKQPTYFNALKSTPSKAFKYYDGQTIDSRLVIVNALQAQAHEATILTRTRFISAKRYASHWLSTLKGKSGTIDVQSKIIINATGPWLQKINDILQVTPPELDLSLVQGSHIVVPKLYQGEFAYILQNDDKRIIFAIPYHQNFTLIGTTEYPLKEVPQNCQMSQDELDYLIQITCHYFEKQISANDIVHSYCGIRPLLASKKSKSSRKISRDYKILQNVEAAPMFSIFGGKITTFRLLAKECLDLCQNIFPKLPECQTEFIPLPGSNFKNIEDLKKNLKKKFSFLTEKQITYYCNLYGSRTFDLLANCQTLDDLGELFGGQLYRQEVDFLIKNEWAETADDILWRRTKQGLYFNKQQVNHLESYLKTA